MAQTSFIGPGNDASVGSNWTNGVPASASTDVLFGPETVVPAATGFDNIIARDIYVDPTYTADIHKPGDRAELLSCERFFHQGPGAVHVEFANTNRYIHAGPGYSDITVASSLVSLEQTGGKVDVTIDSTFGPELTYLGDPTLRAVLTMRGTNSASCGEALIGPGRFVTSQIDWTTLTIDGGADAIIESGAVTTLRSNGSVRLLGGDTITTAYVTSGSFILAAPGGCTITTLYVSSRAKFVVREGLDTIGTIVRIGDRGSI